MARLYLENKSFIDTSEPLDISIPLRANDRNPKAWYVDAPRFEPVRTERFTGSVLEGGAVNFRNIYFNPHGHGTHTECLGHITKEVYSINDVLTEFFFTAKLVSLLPRRKENGSDVDFVIVADQLSALDIKAEALIIRTMPNSVEKTTRNYSASNPPYFDSECVQVLLDAGVKHFITDLPSVDREVDGGELNFHHAFWGVPKNPNFERTITELAFIQNDIKDGEYLLNLHVAPFANDASPSRPVLYKIYK